MENFVRTIRVRERYKQRELANASGLKQSILCNIELGKTKLSAKHLAKIENGFKNLKIKLSKQDKKHLGVLSVGKFK